MRHELLSTQQLGGKKSSMNYTGLLHIILGNAVEYNNERRVDVIQIRVHPQESEDQDKHEGIHSTLYRQYSSPIKQFKIYKYFQH